MPGSTLRRAAADFLALSATAAALAVSGGAWANSYAIMDLGGNKSPKQMNRHGEIAGNSATQPYVYLGERWHKLGCTGQATALGIGPGGDVVGSSGQLPVVWPRHGECATLPLPAGGIEGFAFAEAADGSTAGQFYTTAGGVERCFIDLPNGTSQDLGLDYCDVHGLDDDGQVVGHAVMTLGGNYHAYLWQAGRARDLGLLPGGVGSGALAINVKGHVVGYVNMPDSTFKAFLWTPGGMQDISDPAYDNSYPLGINDRGEIVGQAWNNPGVNPHAVRFEGGQAIRLASEVVDLGNWQLLSAVGVDDQGNIVGLGRRGQGKYHTYMLVPQAASAAAR